MKAKEIIGLLLTDKVKLYTIKADDLQVGDDLFYKDEEGVGYVIKVEKQNRIIVVHVGEPGYSNYHKKLFREGEYVQVQRKVSSRTYASSLI